MRPQVSREVQIWLAGLPYCLRSKIIQGQILLLSSRMRKYLTLCFDPRDDLSCDIF
jgi:hypothetical protein